MAKRKFKLTWQKGTGSRPGRWRKVIYGSVYYFDGGNGKSDQVAYKAAVAEYEKLKSELSATQNPHRTEYSRVAVATARRTAERFIHFIEQDNRLTHRVDDLECLSSSTLRLADQ